MTSRRPRLVFAGQPSRPLRSLPEHEHRVWIVIWYTRGRGEVIVGDRVIPFRRGTVVCIPPRTAYSERSVAGFVSLYLGVEDLPLRGVVVSSLGDDRRFALAAQLVLEQARRTSDPGHACADALALVVRDLVRVPGRDPADPLIAAAVDLVHRHGADPAFAARALARRLAVEPRRLRRAFRAALGTTPLGFLTAFRIAEAKRLLSSGGFAVGDVAARCGFADRYYFSRAFRRETGQSPLAFRSASG